MTTYEELENRDGTIYKGDRSYANPEALALDMGISSTDIDWGQIAKAQAPPAPQIADDVLAPEDTELSGAQADYYETLTPEYYQNLKAQSDSDIMKKYQQEIDSLEAERVQARGRLTSQYGQIGKERQGTSTAVQGSRGLIGSTMGIQQKQGMATQTQQEEDMAIAYSNAQYAERKRAVMGDVRTAQSEEAKIRLEASQLGSQAKIEEIRGRKERSNQRVSTTIGNLLRMKTDVEDEDLMSEVAEGLGISVSELKNKYKKSYDEATEAQRIAQEEQLDIEMKRNYTKEQIAKMQKDREMIDKKFEQDKLEYSYDYAMQEKEFALDQWEAEQKATIDRYKATKPQSYAPSSSKKLYNELGGQAGTGKNFNNWYKEQSGNEDTVDWSPWVEEAGLTGWSQDNVDDIFNLTSPPDWFNKSMEQEFKMSKDWQEEWTEGREKVLTIYEEDNTGGYTDTELRKLRQKGLENASIQEKDDYLYGKEEISSSASMFDEN